MNALLVAPLAVVLAAAPPTPALTGAYTCRTLGDMVGPEDYAVLDQEGSRSLLVSANPYRPGDTGPSQGIFAVDLRTGASEALPIADRDACSFHPHGVDVGGTVEAPELLVVTHFREADADNSNCNLMRDAKGRPLLDAVERFAVEPEGLRFLERLQDPLMTEPNDLAVTDDGRIFMSNNPEFSPIGLIRGALLGWRPSQVLAYQPGQGWRRIARRFFYSNGVVVDARGDVIVASYGGKLTRLSPDGDAWEKAEVIHLRGAMDNLMIGDDGRLWASGHPDSIAFSKHAKDAANIAPTVAYGLSWTEQGWRADEGWLDETGTVSAGATASRLGQDLVFSQVFQPGLIACSPR